MKEIWSQTGCLLAARRLDPHAGEVGAVGGADRGGGRGERVGEHAPAGAQLAAAAVAPRQRVLHAPPEQPPQVLVQVAVPAVEERAALAVGRLRVRVDRLDALDERRAERRLEHAGHQPLPPRVHQRDGARRARRAPSPSRSRRCPPAFAHEASRRSGPADPRRRALAEHLAQQREGDLAAQVDRRRVLHRLRQARSASSCGGP